MKNVNSKLTLVQIAKQAGVSIASVSRYFNDKRSVGKQVQNKITEALAELEQDFNLTPFRRKFRQDRVIGLIVPDIQNPFFPALIKGIESISKTRSYDLILCDSEGDPELELKQLGELWDIGISGIIFIPSGSGDPNIDAAVTRYQPIVFLDRVFNMDGICSVRTNNIEGAMQATRYLIDLGHTDIIYLTRPLEVSSLRERLDGFTGTLKANGIQPEPWRIITVENTLRIPSDRDYFLDRAYGVVKDLLHKQAPFTAIFAADDIMALGARKAVEDAELDVPNDISIIGYDDIPLSHVVGLTTVSQPAYEMGKNAAILVIDLIEDRTKPPKEIILRSSIVIRDTCRRITSESGVFGTGST